MPVFSLLGGPYRTRVVPYATGLYYKQGRDAADQIRMLQDETRGFVVEGFGAIREASGWPLPSTFWRPCPPFRHRGTHPPPTSQYPLLEPDRNPNPLREELSTVPIHTEGGVAPVPLAPDLGISIDEGGRARYRVA